MTSAADGTGGSLPPAGWYPDAAVPGRERLWTGERWIDWIRPAKEGRTEATPTGWYPDAGRPGFERLWSGEMWTDEIRRAGTPGATPLPPPVAVGTAEGATGAPGPAASQPQFQPQQMPPLPLPRATASYFDDNPPYRLGGLANLLTVAFVVGILAAIAQLIADQIYIGVETDLLDGRLPSLSHVHSAADGARITRLIVVIVFFVTAILFVTWFYRAYRNLVRAGVSDLRFAPGWAIGGWFIPIFSYFRQKAIANDIWKASASAATVGLARRREIPLSGVLNWWWGTWVASSVLSGFGSFRARRGGALTESPSGTVFLSGDPHQIHLQRTWLWFAQFGLLFSIVAAVLAILFVREVSRLQDDHFEARVPGSP